MTYEEVRKTAAERTTLCKVCPSCNGNACKGKIPGPGSAGHGKSFTQAIEYLSNIDIMMDVIYDHDGGIDMAYDFFGRELSMPVMGAPCGGSQFNFGVAQEVLPEEAFVKAQLEGAIAAGTIGFMPDGAAHLTIRNHFETLDAVGGITVPTIKPWENSVMKELISAVEAKGAIACATDVDSAGLINVRLLGTPCEPKSKAEIRDLVESTKLPLLVKGIVTPKAAETVLEAGAAGVIVSNHGGRIMADCPAPITTLADIRAAVGKDAKVIVDGGIRSGADVFKALALGADAVLIGRPVCIAAIGGGAEGVKMYFDKIRQELDTTMMLTGCKTLADITADKIRNRN